MRADELVRLVEHAIAQALTSELPKVEARLLRLEGTAAALDTRVGAVELIRVQPGPEGPPGPAGPEGAPGAAGRDGQDGQGLKYCGVYQAGATYSVGDFVTHNGSLYHANAATDAKPADGSAGWTLAVKHGRDGKDGKPMTPLVSLQVAKDHLRITDAAHDAEVTLKSAHASAIIVDYLKDRADPEWTDVTAPLPVQAAVLKLLGNLYEHRGDDAEAGAGDFDDGIWLSIEFLLKRLRDPALA